MDETEIKGLMLMLGSGALSGVLFNIAITGNPIDLGGILGGVLAGGLMFILS